MRPTGPGERADGPATVEELNEWLALMGRPTIQFGERNDPPRHDASRYYRATDGTIRGVTWVTGHGYEEPFAQDERQFVREHTPSDYRPLPTLERVWRRMRSRRRRG